MNFNFKELLELQIVLDNRIEGNTARPSLDAKGILNMKLLAFIVELCELANETRCFKYWSRRSASEDEVIFEEYADGLHFLLSIGITKQWETKEFNLKTTRTSDKELLVGKFNEIINIATTYFQNQNIDVYYFVILEKYLQLGGYLGMTSKDIIKSYKDKNKVNHKRQEEGY